jgi:hypothetical protein
VDDHAILQVDARPEGDAGQVAADDDVEPQVDVAPQRDVADHEGVVGDVRVADAAHQWFTHTRSIRLAAVRRL